MKKRNAFNTAKKFIVSLTENYEKVENIDSVTKEYYYTAYNTTCIGVITGIAMCNLLNIKQMQELLQLVKKRDYFKW